MIGFSHEYLKKANVKKGGFVMNLDELKKIAINYLEERIIEGEYLEYKKSHLLKDKNLKHYALSAIIL